MVVVVMLLVATGDVGGGDAAGDVGGGDVASCYW